MKILNFLSKLLNNNTTVEIYRNREMLFPNHCVEYSRINHNNGNSIAGAVFEFTDRGSRSHSRKRNHTLTLVVNKVISIFYNQ